MKKKNNFKTKIIFGLAVVLLIGIILGINFISNSNVKEVNALEQKFNELNNAGTNFCAGPNILDKVDSDRLQGSCCSAMDFHRYKEQVEGLKKYKDIEKIPKDPYDIPKSLAEELLSYQKNIKLNEEQQKIYDEAVKISHEGGPCCCKCWRWYAFEGLAKYLITEQDFNAEQIADVWDLSDGCGGSGHAHGENGEMKGH